MIKYKVTVLMGNGTTEKGYVMANNGITAEKKIIRQFPDVKYYEIELA